MKMLRITTPEGRVYEVPNTQSTRVYYEQTNARRKKGEKMYILEVLPEPKDSKAVAPKLDNEDVSDKQDSVGAEAKPSAKKPSAKKPDVSNADAPSANADSDVKAIADTPEVIT